MDKEMTDFSRKALTELRTYLNTEFTAKINKCIHSELDKLRKKALSASKAPKNVTWLRVFEDNVEGASAAILNHMLHYLKSYLNQHLLQGFVTVTKTAFANFSSWLSLLDTGMQSGLHERYITSCIQLQQLVFLDTTTAPAGFKYVSVVDMPCLIQQLQERYSTDDVTFLGSAMLAKRISTATASWSTLTDHDDDVMDIDECYTDVALVHASTSQDMPIHEASASSSSIHSMGDLKQALPANQVAAHAHSVINMDIIRDNADSSAISSSDSDCSVTAPDDRCDMTVMKTVSGVYGFYSRATAMLRDHIMPDVSRDDISDVANTAIHDLDSILDKMSSLDKKLNSRQYRLYICGDTGRSTCISDVCNTLCGGIKVSHTIQFLLQLQATRVKYLHCHQLCSCAGLIYFTACGCL
jgi:hypothetical protein